MDPHVQAQLQAQIQQEQMQQQQALLQQQEMYRQQQLQQQQQMQMQQQQQLQQQQMQQQMQQQQQQVQQQQLQEQQMQQQMQQQQIQLHQQQMQQQLQQQQEQQQFQQPRLPGSTQQILCCLCGTPVPPNPSNMCVSCIRTQADVTEDITKSGTIFQCRHCLRFLGTRWIGCELESRELLAICLKKVHGITKGVRLVDAGFVWTEPHSKRIKVRLTVQGEVLGGTILQQNTVVEFVVHNQQCPDCQRSFTPHEGWKAVVQLRQKVAHKRTFLYLEQLLLKHKAHGDAIRVKELGDGLDFFFPSKSAATKFVDFVHGVTPARAKQSKKLVSQDFSSNTTNFTYSFSVEIAPVCKDDMVLLPLRLAQHLGSISPLLLVSRVSSFIHLLDPVTLQHAEINTQQYWQANFPPLCQRDQLVEYIVIDVVPTGAVRGRNVLAEATVARASDLGSNDVMFSCVTHLGALLRAGDTALGYDLGSANFNADLSVMKGRELPDVVLVRKKFNVPKRRKKRVFKLERLDKEELEIKARGKRDPNEKTNVEYEQFLQDLEEDPEMRYKINLYQRDGDTNSQVSTSVAGTVEEDPTFPKVSLDELVGRLTIND